MNKNQMNIISMKAWHEEVWDFRDKYGDYFKAPTTPVSLEFACTEIGETLDIKIRNDDSTFLRNQERKVTIGEELADTLLMLLTAAGKDVPDETWWLSVYQNESERCTILSIGSAIWNVADLYEAYQGRYFDYQVSCLHLAMRIGDLMIKFGYSPLDELTHKLDHIYSTRILPVKSADINAALYG